MYDLMEFLLTNVRDMNENEYIAKFPDKTKQLSPMQSGIWAMQPI